MKRHETNQEVKIQFREYGEIIIPKGTKLTHVTACGVDPKYNFVDDLSFIDKKEMYSLWYDAEHYGINIPKEFVIEES